MDVVGRVEPLDIVALQRFRSPVPEHHGHDHKPDRLHKRKKKRKTRQRLQQGNDDLDEKQKEKQNIRLVLRILRIHVKKRRTKKKSARCATENKDWRERKGPSTSAARGGPPG
eukprot:3133232-Rhodomonas_salina.1